MFKGRLRYQKTGTARWISHLDLMRVFRRTFARAQLPLVFSQGFNPHPYLSVPLPLPTGYASVCELLDFDLDADAPPEDFLARFNAALPPGIWAETVYEREKKAGELAFAAYTVHIYGDIPTPEAARALFAGGPLVLEKRTKSGTAPADIRPLIKSLEASARGDALVLEAVLAVGNESLNPAYLTEALRVHGGAAPARAEYLRTAVYDAALRPFA